MMKLKWSVIFRFACILALWVIFCWWYLTGLSASVKAGNAQWTLMTLWPLPVSAVVVFVPLYKKYIRNDKAKR